MARAICNQHIAQKVLTAKSAGPIVGLANAEENLPSGEACTMKRCLGTLALLCAMLLTSISLAQDSILQKPCADCHGSETKYPVRGVRSQYLTSGHRTLGNAHYANSDDCQGCHTNEGFIERAKTGKVDVKKFVLRDRLLYLSCAPRQG